jgi:hypothetical protein
MKPPHRLYKPLVRMVRSRSSQRVQKVLVVICGLYIFGQVIVAVLLGRFVIGGR